MDRIWHLTVHLTRRWRQYALPVCSSLLSWKFCVLFVAALFLYIYWDVSVLLLYDRQALLDIQASSETWVHRLGLENWTTSPLPVLSGIPAYLRRSPDVLPRKKRCRRRGKRGGVLVKFKIHLISSCATDPRLLCGGHNYLPDVWRSVKPEDHGSDLHLLLFPAWLCCLAC